MTFLDFNEDYQDLEITDLEGNEVAGIRCTSENCGKYFMVAADFAFQKCPFCKNQAIMVKRTIWWTCVVNKRFPFSFFQTVVEFPSPVLVKPILTVRAENQKNQKNREKRKKGARK